MSIFLQSNINCSLTNLPAGWGIAPIKTFCSILGRGQSPEYSDGTGFFVANQACLSTYTFRKYKQKECMPMVGSKGRFAPGDVLIASTGGGILGKVAVAEESGYCDSHVSVLRMHQLGTSQFIYRWMSINYDLINDFFAKGSTNQTEFQKNAFLAFQIAFPPLPEQIAITKYLDKTTALIDKQRDLLARKKALLQEHKKALIHEAVTKGLNPGVPMKQSGVGWIGDVPSHWRLARYQEALHHFGKRSGAALQLGAISYGKAVYKDAEKVATETAETYQAVFAGDILINPINLNYDLKSLRTALSGINIAVSPAYIVAHASKNWSSRYLAFLLYCFDLYEMKTLGAGVRQTITFADIAKSFSVFPPLSEQIAIADYLDKTTSLIDIQCELLGKKIEALSQLRSSVIHEAVTKGIPATAVVC